MCCEGRVDVARTVGPLLLLSIGRPWGTQYGSLGTIACPGHCALFPGTSPTLSVDF